MDIVQWQLWVIAGLIAGGLEIKVSGFVFAWFALGALGAALAAAVGLGPTAQVIVYLAISLSLFALSRTIFSSLLMRTATTQVKVGTDAMVGAEATVIEALPAEGGNGTVRINGELWHARSIDGAIAAGTPVVIESVEGLKLKVRRQPTGPLAVIKS